MSDQLIGGLGPAGQEAESEKGELLRLQLRMRILGGDLGPHSCFPHRWQRSMASSTPSSYR